VKWFIKVLRQYADFSGRARRKEYGYFALFSFTAAIAVVVIDLLAGWNIVSCPAACPGGACPVPDRNSCSAMCLPKFGPCFLAYVVATLLPGLAVAVRRLHDVGKSGWWMFLSLIPVVGVIWLLILFCAEGQSEQNRYGANPKSVQASFPESRREKSIAIAFIVGAAVELGVSVFEWIHFDLFTSIPFRIWLIPALTVVFTLFFGLFYYPAGDPDQTAKRRKIAFILLAMALLIPFIQFIWKIPAWSESWSNEFSGLELTWQWANSIVFGLRNLAMLALVVLLLFKSERKKMAPVAALSLVLFAISVVMFLVWPLVMHVDLQPFGIIFFIAFILLAAHCLRTSEPEEPLQPADEINK
jgi:uncharacterized membrane protein YhaH (DUF805 family)